VKSSVAASPVATASWYVIAMKALASLRLWAMLEGISFLVLLLVAMPLKYAMGLPLAVRVVGSLHGLLFLVFLSALYRVHFDRRWPAQRSLMAFAAALVPAGTFWLDRVLAREIASLSASSSASAGSAGAPADGSAAHD